nr:hypothetical protein BaRGS_024200 [Batillaria attramentaria]
MDPDLFVGSQLDTVVLSYNVFRYVGPERLEKLLRPLSGVRKLEMSEIGLDKIPEVITREFVNLKSLGVKSNVISGLPADAFRNLTELNHLDLMEQEILICTVCLIVIGGIILYAILYRFYQLWKKDETCRCASTNETSSRFQPEILYLNFSHNGLATLDDDTLQNVTQLQWLILNKNHISHVTQNAFRGMTSLECLEMAHNNIRIRVRPKNFTIAVNKVSTLKLLALNFTQFAKERMKGPGVEYIMRNLRLPNLTKLFTTTTTVVLVLVVVVVVMMTTTTAAAATMMTTTMTMMMMMMTTTTTITMMMTVVAMVIVVVVVVVAAAAAAMMMMMMMMICRFTNVMFIEKEAFNHSSLRELNVQSSNWFFDRLHASNFHPDLFLGSNLTWLDLSYNVFRFVSPERLRQILKPLYTVRQLYMAELGLFNIPSTITSTFVDLEIFWFNANLVSGLQPNTFENLTRLTDLNLRDNLLTSPNIEAIRRLTRGKGRNVTVKVNLGWNPYSCTCDLLDFLHMLKRSYTEDTGGGGALGVIADYDTDAALEIVGDQFKCYSPAHVENTSLFDLEMTQQMCLLTVQQVIMIHCICIIAILAVVIYSVLYR